MINVLIYNEFGHEQTEERVRKVYPDGIHGCIKAFLEREDDISVSTVTLDNVNDITDELLDKTDVIIWWGHMAHGEVKDEIVDRVQQRVLQGMGLIVLHSGHFSKIFRRMMGSQILRFYHSHRVPIQLLTFLPNQNHSSFHLRH